MKVGRAAALAALVLVGCAHDVRTQFPRPPPEGPRGTLELRFTGAVKNAHVTVNGVPVAEGAHTRRIVVTGVPAGPTAVVMAADGLPMEKAFTIEIPAGERVVVPLSAPSASFGGVIVQAVATVAVYAAYLGLRSLF